MAIDTYARCPGGTGKKIKFCCSDLVGDLEQLDRLIEGDQITAALDQVQRLQAKYPGRACLMSARTKLELGTKRFAEAAASSQAFLEAFPENPLALGQAAITDALAGRMQEAAIRFDKARSAAVAIAQEGNNGEDSSSEELVRIAATLVQAAAQLGQVGFAQGVVDWLTEGGLASDEERRILASFVGSSGIPPALRTKLPFAELSADTPWRVEFDKAIENARHWRLAQALTTFRSLKGAAATSQELFTNIAVLCEMLALPMEAAEAWLTLAKLPGISADEAVEATGRAIALESVAHPERSPLIRFRSRIAPLSLPLGEDGSAALELLEDKLRHDPRCEVASFDRSAWVSRNAAPPRSAWRIYEVPQDQASLPRLLASLLLFGRQTDREPEAVLQGFGPDVEVAVPLAEGLLGCSFAAAEAEAPGMPGVTPTNWLLGTQLKTPLPETEPAAPEAGQPALFDTLVHQQRDGVARRFVAHWPDTPLPELLGKTPRQAVADAEGRRRVEAIVTEGEAMSRRSEIMAAWASLREPLGLPAAARIDNQEPLGTLPPMRWHRIDMAAVPIDQLRGLFLTALDAGFELAAERAAESLATRSDATSEDRWEALGFLVERAESSVRRLELIAQLRAIAKELGANDGMLDVAELRVRMQRGDGAEATRLLEHLQREHGRDQQVFQALAEVLMEAGVDLGGMAARGGAPAGNAQGGGAGLGLPSAPPQPGKLWTPGGEPAAGGGGEKKLWTPG